MTRNIDAFARTLVDSFGDRALELAARLYGESHGETRQSWEAVIRALLRMPDPIRDDGESDTGSREAG